MAIQPEEIYFEEYLIMQMIQECNDPYIEEYGVTQEEYNEAMAIGQGLRNREVW